MRQSLVLNHCSDLVVGTKRWVLTVVEQLLLVRDLVDWQPAMTMVGQVDADSLRVALVQHRSPGQEMDSDHHEMEGVAGLLH